MYRSKKDVDKHVQNLTSKLPLKEFQTRAYSIARLYFEVGDYASCQKYVEQYLVQKDNNAAAHKLLGLALQKMGQKQKALEHYKTSLDIDPTQTSTILEICELLADDQVEIDVGRSKYWCEKAEATFPRHPITFKLRERLLAITDPDSEALVGFLKDELSVRPKDIVLHIRLLKYYLHSDKIKEAFEHSCNVEFEEQIYLNNYTWYDTVCDILEHNALNTGDWLYQLLLLTVKERVCLLSLSEIPNGSSRSLVETNEVLSAYDQAIEIVSKKGGAPGFGEFHAYLVQHHRGQLSFHIATYLLKKAKRNQLTWRDASKLAGPLMLLAWQIVPLEPSGKWLKHTPKKQQNAMHRWFIEGSYRCSQAGHYILSNIQENSQVFLDHISQFCASGHWRDKIYETVFSDRELLVKNKMSYLMSDAFSAPVMRLPKKQEVEAYDEDAQKENPNSLHHFVWILLNYKNFAKFKCSLFDMLSASTSYHGSESLNKLDVLAFLYCSTLAVRNKENVIAINSPGKPTVLPANIMDLLCSVTQMKWWDCAYKYSQRELGEDLTGINATLSFGMEVVRCVDNHGLDPQLLCILGDIFNEKAKECMVTDEKSKLEKRAFLYYSSAINLLERLKTKVVLKMPDKRLFEYNHKDLDTKEINALLEKCKIYVAMSNLNDGEYEKAIDILSNLKSSRACYYTSETYKKLAFEEKKASDDSEESEFKYVTLLNKAKHFAYKALKKLKETEICYKDNPLYLDIQDLIEDVECCLNKVDADISYSAVNEFLSDDNEPLEGNEYIPHKSNTNLYHRTNVSSTPKPPKKYTSNVNITHYRTAAETQILDNSTMDHQVLERIEKQIKILQRKDTTINDLMEQNKEWFDENRKLSNQIINTINSNIQTTTEQFKLLKISVDQVKDQLEECKNECKDVGDLKKQLADLKKEVNKLKKTTSEQTIDESDLYNLDEEYRGNDNVAGFGTQVPFGPSQVLPQFGRSVVPPFPANPYQLYGQNFYSLYNQYSHFPQVSVPGAPQLFDPTRSQTNYPGVYTTPDQMYLDVSHLVAPTMPIVHTVPTVPTVPSVPVPVSSIPTAPIVTSAPTKISLTTSKVAPKVDLKDNSRLPVNVVITSSDPLPACTSTPAPILSVTIPQKHIKGSPHNYQIAMPPANDAKGITPASLFSFPSAGNKGTSAVSTTAVTSVSLSNWNQSTVFATSRNDKSGNLLNVSVGKPTANTATGVDGAFPGTSPNNSLNKSRTLSEKSNTSIENYDPCPDFKPIIPLPAEVKVTTGEEDEQVIFSSRAKLFRFVDKQWKERGLGEMKLLKHKVSGKVRVLMRREQIHKVCANHIISAEMEIKPMKNETKAYIWVANDFAEETVILEKFCIRFKTADIAKQFYEVFEKARQEALVSNKNDSIVKSEEVINLNDSRPDVTSTPNKINAADAGKTVVGGFTFSAAPTFKPVSESSNAEKKATEAVPDKTNVFSGLSLKTATSSPFANIFSPSPHQNITDINIQKNASNKLNTSDVVEEFEPTVEFKPVIPLPALIDQKTGEEDEIILFEHRAKLLRFDASAKEWKERGLGNIKLLVHKDNVSKLRLLMRREQIMKVCCNHAITKDMVFQKMPKIDKAVTWCAKDFSEGELVAETFCLRFKTVQACDNFISAITAAQCKIKDDTKAVKEEKNAAKQNTHSGFGDKFKPKPGSWHCATCYTNNLENFEQCACCEQPKPNVKSANYKSTIPASYSFGFGDKFKAKPDTWECKSCMIRNNAENDVCSACNSKRDTTTQKSDSTFLSKNPPMMFGIPGQTQNSLTTTKTSTASGVFGWGDKFKPKEGSWECNQCLVRNDGNLETCSACSNPRNPLKDHGDNKNTNKYNFGILNTDSKNINQVSNLFETPATQKFNFGIPANQTAIVVSFGEQKATTSVFAITKQPAANDSPINFCLKKADESKPSKPALLPTPQLNWTEIKNFDFMGLKSKEPTNTTVIDFSTHQKIPFAKEKSNQNKSLDNKNKLKILEGGSDDVIFVKEIQATAEEKQKAKQLMLPENFYTYTTKDPCQGCRGCKSDEEDVILEQSIKPNKVQPKSGFGVSTPMKTSISNFQTPTNSVYGTPTSGDKSFDTSIFRTPLGAVASSKSNSITSSTNSVDAADETEVTNMENSGADKTVTDEHAIATAKTFVLMPSKLGSLSTSKEGKDEAEGKSDPKVAEIQSTVSGKPMGVSMNESIFSTNFNKVEKSMEPAVRSIFGTDDQKPINLFSGTSQGSLFGPAAMKTQESIFGPAAAKNFGPTQSSVFGNVFNSSSNVFGTKPVASRHLESNTTTEDADSNKAIEVKPKDKKEVPFNIDNNLTFAALSTSGPAFNAEKKDNFQWEGTGQQLFGTGSKENNNKLDSKSDAADDSGAAQGADEEYDPHYEPIIPLPDKIIVTTGEEDEEKLFGERCKLFRYDERSREWKERGIGEMKLLYHPARNTYRLLLRREQVHKAVLNMLLFKNLVLLPMKNSDRAWTWAGQNFAEGAAEHETLAVRFKSVDLAKAFHDKVVDCVQKLQAAPEESNIEASKEVTDTFTGVAPLRLPKHLETSARADEELSAKFSQQAQATPAPTEPQTSATVADKNLNHNGQLASEKPQDEPRQVHFEKPEQENTNDDDDDEDEDYEHDYDNSDDYPYEHEEDEDTAIYFACNGEAVVQQGDSRETYQWAHILLASYQESYSPKILVSDAHSGEIVAEMLIQADMEFQLMGDTCTWSGQDYTQNAAVHKTVTFTFSDSDSAMQFYDSCEASKTATYTSTDPEG